METKLKQLELELAAEREFVNMATHQLQEPLASVKWLLEGLLAGQSGQLTAKQRETVVKLNETNESTITLITDLLMVARLEDRQLTVKKQPTDLEVLVQRIMRRHSPEIKEHHGQMYFTGTKQQIPLLEIDPTLFSQAVDNLISNAIKYNPIRTHISVTITADKETVTIAVRNRGPVIPADKQKILFRKFTRAETRGTQKTSGTGLGLYITKKIVELHGGEILYTSTEHEGTTFSIRLPRKVNYV